jgi:P-type Cu+ transporter
VSAPLELVIGGMTCASCAARIERRLNRLDGVTASVNYATERAYVTSADGREPGELIGVIESAGYTATPAARPADDDAPPAADPRRLGRRLAVSLPLAVAVIVLSMVPAAQFSGWQWPCLALAGPVAMWGAWPFHRAVPGDGHPARLAHRLAGTAQSCVR